jgi:hypothetical protein
MNKSSINKICDEINKWTGPEKYKPESGDWNGPDGMIWCETKFIDPKKCKDCAGCEVIDVTDVHPSRYLRPTDISW